MSIVTKLINFAFECWDRGISQENIDKKQIFALCMITFVIFVFTFLYFVSALLLLIVLRGVFLHLQETYTFLELNELTWLVIGLIFGIAISLVCQSLPKSNGEPETPRIVCSSFGHHFGYFLALSICIMAWIIIFMILGAF